MTQDSISAAQLTALEVPFDDKTTKYNADRAPPGYDEGMEKHDRGAQPKVLEISEKSRRFPKKQILACCITVGILVMVIIVTCSVV